MLLLASAQFFQIFLGAYYPLIGGTQGISVPDFFGWAGNGIGVRDVAILGFLSVFALLVYVYAERIARSPLGRTLRAVRDNETATRALGKNDVAIRRNVIIIASAIAAMAGALLTFQVASIGPGTWDRITWTFYIWVMVIIGGSGNNLGVALGALSFTSLFDVITQLQNSLPSDLPIEVNWLRYLLFATLLISILAFRPGGILPEKSSLTIQKNKLSRIIKSANVLEVRTVSSSGEKFAADSTPRDSKTTD
jgi:branched-chain amino acid transport system permease protein